MRSSSTSPARSGHLLAGLALAGALLASIPATAKQTYSDFERTRTRGDVEEFVGSIPSRCVPSALGMELCTWHLSNRAPAWRPLAVSIETRDRINLLCEFSAQGERLKRACWVYPRRSDHFKTRIPDRRRRKKSARRRDVPQALVDGPSDRERAERALSEARTILTLSELVGGAPDECFPESSASQRCLWRLSKHDRGWELVSASIETNGRVVLSCRLPLDGGDRGPDSCSVGVGR